MSLLWYVVGYLILVVGDPIHFVGYPLHVLGDPLQVEGDPLYFVGHLISIRLSHAYKFWFKKPSNDFRSILFSRSL